VLSREAGTPPHTRRFIFGNTQTLRSISLIQNVGRSIFGVFPFWNRLKAGVGRNAKRLGEYWRSVIKIDGCGILDAGGGIGGGATVEGTIVECGMLDWRM
jgi:hypothetical protein